MMSEIQRCPRFLAQAPPQGIYPGLIHLDSEKSSSQALFSKYQFFMTTAY